MYRWQERLQEKNDQGLINSFRKDNTFFFYLRIFNVYSAIVPALMTVLQKHLAWNTLQLVGPARNRPSEYVAKVG